MLWATDKSLQQQRMMFAVKQARMNAILFFQSRRDNVTPGSSSYSQTIDANRWKTELLLSQADNG